MKRLPLIAFALAAFTAIPVRAQDQLSAPQIVSDRFDQGDWWGLDVSGTGIGSEESVVLVNGEPVRNGDAVEVETFLMYRQPKPSGVIGGKSLTRIDCVAKTQDVKLLTMFYTGERMRELPAVGTGPKPILPASALYRFACDGNHRYATHFGQGSRTRTATGAFSKYHH